MPHFNGGFLSLLLSHVDVVYEDVVHDVLHVVVDAVHVRVNAVVCLCCEV